MDRYWDESTGSWLIINGNVNSDLNEYLNYLDWIANMNTFGAYSYVFNQSDYRYIKELMTQSLLLYEDTLARSACYDNAPTSVFDYWLVNSVLLSDQMNAYHDTSVYEGNTVDEFLQAVSSANLVALSSNFEDAIYRYLDDQFNNTSGVGEWIADTYNLNHTTLDGLATLSDVAGSSAGMTECATSKPFIRDVVRSSSYATILNSSNAMEKIAASTNVSVLFESAIYSTCMPSISASTTASSAIGGSVNSVTAIYASASAMTFITSDTGYLPKYIGDSYISSCIIANTSYGSFANWTDVAGNTTAMNAMVASVQPMNCIFRSGTAMAAISTTSIAYNIINGSTSALDKIVTVSLALNYVIKDSGCSTALDTNFQSRRSSIITSLADTNYFTKTSAYRLSATDEGDFDHGANTNRYYIPIYSYATDVGCGTSASGHFHSYVNLTTALLNAALGGGVVTTKLGMRGARLTCTYFVGSVYFDFDYYTAV